MTYLQAPPPLDATARATLREILDYPSDYTGECDRLLCHRVRPLWVDNDSDPPESEVAYCAECWRRILGNETAERAKGGAKGPRKNNLMKLLLSEIDI
ncbi:MAG: hypothetical protein IID42_04130 [Planctomycetes bacterium]|nr:hypothetical protein [Planctomycetota bacterium]